MSKYKIIIVELKTETKVETEYERITSKEVALEMFEKTGEKPEEYDYVKTEKEIEVEETIYKQIVEDFDLVSVINAVNKAK